MDGGYGKESMMNQAQQVWTMLDDMAENDPKAYKAFIDKQMQERKEFMSPAEPHMCVQTWMVVGYCPVVCDRLDNLCDFYVSFS